jgi:hypothetical protein
MAEEAVGSFPYEEWANEVRNALNGKGVDAEVAYAGPRAYPVFIDERDSDRAQEVLSDIGYMSCSAGPSRLGLSGVLSWRPFDGSQEDIEELESDLSSAIDRMIEKLANASAAQSWSHTEEHDVYIIADFDGEIAVNGELIINRPIPPVPPGFVRTHDGGRIPTTEEEISLDHVVSGVLADPEFEKYGKEDLAEILNRVLEQKYPGKNLAYTSVSGETEVYRKKDSDEE